MEKYLQEKLQANLVEEKVIRNIRQKYIRIKQLKNSLDEIASHVFADGIFSVYPKSSNTDDNGVRSKLENRMRRLTNGAGLGIVYKSLAVSVNLDIQQPRPDEVLYDVCFLRQNHPTVILTVIPDDVRDIKSLKRYNLSVTSKMIEAIRKFTIHNFSAVYGLVKESDLASDETFTNSLDIIVENKSRFCIPCSLDMPADKYRSIVTALLSSIAQTQFVTLESTESCHDTVWLLTHKQFRILTECIDEKDVNVKTSQSCGGTVLLLETANRLEKFGSSLIISNDQKVLKIASEKKLKVFEPSQVGKPAVIDDPVENVISNSSLLTRQQLRQRFPNSERLWIFEMTREPVEKRLPVEVKQSASTLLNKVDGPKCLSQQLSKMIKKITGPKEEQNQTFKKSERSREQKELRRRRKCGATFRRSNQKWNCQA